MYVAELGTLGSVNVDLTGATARKRGDFTRTAVSPH